MIVQSRRGRRQPIVAAVHEVDLTSERTAWRRRVSGQPDAQAKGGAAQDRQPDAYLCSSDGLAGADVRAWRLCADKKNKRGFDR